MILKNSFYEKLENSLKYYGIQGENAFNVLISFYLTPKKIDKNERLLDLKNKGCQILDKCKNSEALINLLTESVKSDPKGEYLPIWYQICLGRQFRAGSGKFFTPKNIASEMVKLFPIKDNAVIMDPTCGGGTFLLEASKIWGEKTCTLLGNDIDPILVDLSEVLLALGTPEHQSKRLFTSNIYEQDKNMQNLYGKVDYVVANPPFGIKLKTIQLNSKIFYSGYKDTDAVFIDFAFKLLKPDGRLVCLLPHSFVANKENECLRKLIESNWDLLGVILLPEGIFYLTADTSTRADIVILKKKGNEPPTETLVLSNAPSIGISLNSRDNKEIINALKEITDNQIVMKSLGIDK